MDIREKKKDFDEGEGARSGKSNDRQKRSWMPHKKKNPEPDFDEKEFEAALDLAREHKDAYTQLEVRIE